MKYICICLLMLLGTEAFADSQSGDYKSNLSIGERQLLAATHIGDVQRKTGYFSYEFDFVTGKWSKSDSLVRQAGASYGLSEYLLTHRDEIARGVVEKAMKAYRANSVSFEQGKLLTVNQDLKGAESGATALVLIGAIQYAKATGDHQFDGDVQAWKDGLLALYHPQGGFAGGAANPKESPYFNGEAWLALSIYHENYPEDGKVNSILPAVDDAMMRIYSAAPDIGFFHWGLMATAKRYEKTKDQKFIEFGVQQVTDFLTRMRSHFSDFVNSCYSVEGMAAILPHLLKDKKYEALADRLLARVRQEMTKNISMQIVPDQRVLSLVGGRTLVAPELPRFTGAFINGLDRPQSRIDFTQHCLSALLKSEIYLNN